MGGVHKGTRFSNSLFRASQVTCEDCLPGLQTYSDGSCGPCTGTSYALILFAAVAVVVLNAVLYISLDLGVDRTTQEAHMSIFVLAMTQFLGSPVIPFCLSFWGSGIPCKATNHERVTLIVVWLP